jgi:hypothetical protein
MYIPDWIEDQRDWPKASKILFPAAQSAVANSAEK